MFSLCLSNQILAQGIVFVPSTQSNDASFAEGAESDKKGLYTAKGGDGASLVVGGSALVTALDGAQISCSKSETKSPLCSIKQGGFQISVGSTQTAFELGGLSSIWIPVMFQRVMFSWTT